MQYNKTNKIASPSDNLLPSGVHPFGCSITLAPLMSLDILCGSTSSILTYHVFIVLTYPLDPNTNNPTKTNKRRAPPVNKLRRIMEYVSDGYEKQLKHLASLLCPLKEVVEINPLTIPRDEEHYSFQYDIDDTRTGFDISGNFHRNRWESCGEYFTGDLQMEDSKEVPRFRIIIQDGVTELQAAAGADDIDLFAKSDLMKFIAHLKKQIAKLEETAIPPKEAIEAEIVKRKGKK